MHLMPVVATGRGSECLGPVHLLVYDAGIYNCLNPALLQV